MKKQTKLEELEKRIAALEARPVYIYQPPLGQGTTSPPMHYHGQMLCWNNPCYWCGAI